MPGNIVQRFKRKLGSFIRTLRQEKGMTMAQLAAAIGSSRTTIDAIERGRGWPEEKTWDAICHALATTPDDLFSCGLISAIAERKEKCKCG